MTAVMPIRNLLTPIMGVNTSTAITKPGRLSVDEPCTIASPPSIPTPRLWNAADTGTMQAEHRFITGPRTMPLRDFLRLPPDRTPTPLPFGKRNASVSPATRNANTIPTATSWRYVMEKSHQRSSSVVSSSRSMQKPWKHSTTGPVTTSRSSRTVSSFGNRLSEKKNASSTSSIAIPTARFLPRALLGAPMRPMRGSR